MSRLGARAGAIYRVPVPESINPNAHACAKFPAHAHFLKGRDRFATAWFLRERAIYRYVYLHWVTIANHTTIAARATYANTYYLIDAYCTSKPGPKSKGVGLICKPVAPPESLNPLPESLLADNPATHSTTWTMDPRTRSSLYEGAHGSPLYTAPRRNINPSANKAHIQEEIAVSPC